MKKLFVIGDSNIYGDEQLNDNLNSVANAIAYESKSFNYPSRLTYPYYIPLRKVNNLSMPGLSVDGILDFYNQLALPHIKSDDELIVHIPPVTRDIIYEDLDHFYTRGNLPSKEKHVFKKWCDEYSGIETTMNMFNVCMNLFSHSNFNPNKINEYREFAPGITQFLNDTFWSMGHGLNKLKNLIHGIETTAPCTVYYVFQTFSFDTGDNSLWTKKRKLSVLEKLVKMLAPFNIDITNRIIDDNWIDNMKSISRELDSDIYPRGHFHTHVHKEYCHRFVKKHFTA